MHVLPYGLRVREMKRRRRRGVLLSSRGLTRVHDGQRRLAREHDAIRVSQEALSTVVGVSTRTLARIMRRESPVDLRTLEALFSALRLAIDQTDYVYAEASARNPMHDFPQRFSTLIGRDELIARLEQLLITSRLLTLTGTGGIGKTRVALELALRQRTACQNRLWFVALANVDPVESVASITTAFGIMVERPAMLTTIREQLNEEPGLLVLDSCEPHVAVLGPFVITLLRACPSLRVIATSREPLGVEGERIFRVSPLAIPETDAGITAARALQYSAIALFEQRAGGHKESFVFDDRIAPVVSEIVRRLDGLPLGIELAAARVGVMSVEDLLQHVRGCVSSLVADGTQQDPRHRSLTTLVDWSFDRLSERERLVCRRASTFSGTADVAALQAVCGDELPPEVVLNVVSQLVRKSLLEVDTRTGGTRYFFLDTVRECARDRLDRSSDSAFARWLHALYYARLSGEVMKSFEADDQIVALRSMTREYANVRAALEWSFALSHNEHIGSLLVSELPEYWDARGQYREGEAWIRRALETNAMLLTAGTSAKLLEGLSLLLFRQARLEEASRTASESLAAFREVADDVGLCRARNLLGVIALEAGDAEYARAQFLTNLAMGETLHNARIRIVALNNVGRIEAEVDRDAAGSLRRFQKSLDLATRIGLQTMVAMALRNIAETHAELGNLQLALIYSERGMQASRSLENDALYCIQAMQTATYRIRALGYQRAIGDLRTALDAIATDPYRTELCGQLDTIAQMLIEGDEPARGVMLLGAAAAQRARTQTVRGSAAEVRCRLMEDMARRELGEATYDEIEAFAAELPLEAAFRAALLIPGSLFRAGAVFHLSHGAASDELPESFATATKSRASPNGHARA